MPNWVKDDDKWAEAKKAALKTYSESDPNFYAIVTSIYKKMGGEVMAKSEPIILLFHKARKSS